MLDTFINYNQVVTHSNIVVLAAEIKQALQRKAKQRMATPARELMFQGEPEAVFLSMPAVSQEYGLYINKVASIFERSPSDSLDIVNALVVAFSAVKGHPLALLDGNALTNVKCAAVAAAVTDYCAHKGSRVLAVIGAGVQARQQVKGVCAVREIKQVNVYSRNQSRLNAFAKEVVNDYGVKIVVAQSVDEAIKNADIIGTTTTATAPLSTFSNTQAHVHINCMGGHTEYSREVPEALLKTSFVTVEDRQTAITEAGRIHESAVELSELPAQNAAELQKKRTIFSSTGHSFLDLIATAHVLNNLGLLPLRHEIP